MTNGMRDLESMKDISIEIFKIYDEAKNKILLYVEASVSAQQFVPLRKLILDELGKNGAESRVSHLLARFGQE